MNMKWNEAPQTRPCNTTWWFSGGADIQDDVQLHKDFLQFIQPLKAGFDDLKVFTKTIQRVTTLRKQLQDCSPQPVENDLGIPGGGPASWNSRLKEVRRRLCAECGTECNHLAAGRVVMGDDYYLLEDVEYYPTKNTYKHLEFKFEDFTLMNTFVSHVYFRSLEEEIKDKVRTIKFKMGDYVVAKLKIHTDDMYGTLKKYVYDGSTRLLQEEIRFKNSFSAHILEKILGVQY